jgi:putative membrane protein
VQIDEGGGTAAREDGCTVKSHPAWADTTSELEIVMIRTRLTAAALLLLAGTSLFAQAAYAQSSGGMMASGYQMTDADALASKLIGSNVYSTVATNDGKPAIAATAKKGAVGNAPPAANAAGTPASSANDTNLQQIGTIRDVIIGNNGKVDAVVIGIGGVLGIGEKSVAVAYSDLRWSIAQDGSVRGAVDTTVDALKTAPDFKYPANGQATNTGTQTTGMTAASTAAAMQAAGSPSSNATTAPVTDPQGFASKAAVSNMFEIQASQLALTVSTTPAVKIFAQKMIDDHTKAGQQMQRAAQTENVSVPTALDGPTSQQLAQLKGLSGQQFDQAYIPIQLQAHKDAVALFQTYSTSGQTGALKDFAGETLPTLQMHLKMVRDLAGK